MTITAGTPIEALVFADTLVRPDGRSYAVEYVSPARQRVLMREPDREGTQEWVPVTKLVGWQYVPQVADAIGAPSWTAVSQELQFFRQYVQSVLGAHPSIIPPLVDQTAVWLNAPTPEQAGILAARWDPLADSGWLHEVPDGDATPALRHSEGSTPGRPLMFARSAWRITWNLLRYAATGLEEPRAAAAAVGEPVDMTSPLGRAVNQAIILRFGSDKRLVGVGIGTALPTPLTESQAEAYTRAASAVEALVRVASTVSSDIAPSGTAIRYVLRAEGLTAAPALAAANRQDFVAVVEGDEQYLEDTVQAKALRVLGVPRQRITRVKYVTEIPLLAHGFQIIETAEQAAEVARRLNQRRTIPLALVKPMTDAIQHTDTFLAALGV